MTDQTISAYDQHASTWAAARIGGSYWEESRSWLAAELPQGARVIEFGCGAGWDGAELSKRYDYTGLDGSAGMLTLARQAMPGIPLWHADLRDMTLPPDVDPFDGFWCAAVLLHIPAPELGVVLGNMTAMLTSGAAGFIAVKDGEGSEVLDAPEIPAPRFFQYWDRAGFTVPLGEAGLRVSGYKSRTGNSPGSTLWHTFLVRYEP